MRKLIVLLLFLAACTQIPIEQNVPPEVHFCERENCTELLVGLLTNAEAKCALYDVSVPQLLDALKKVDWKTEDGRSPLMHNKFCVINQSAVWTGSWNPTKTTRANNAVFIHSEYLARNYLDEYAELPGGKRHVVYPQISFNGRMMENYFCPEDDCKERVLSKLINAKHSIVFMLADLTDREIIAQLRRTDIPVEGVIDKSEHDAIEQLRTPHTGSVHHKVFIIDESTVITGSYNPTRNGNEFNDENILIINDRTIAKQFLEEYSHLIS